MGLAQNSSSSQYSERVVSLGNAHEPRVVYGQGFAVHRLFGGGIAFDTGN